MSNSVYITLYDVSGAPLDPNLVKDLEKEIEKLAKKEKSLAITITRE